MKKGLLLLFVLLSAIGLRAQRWDFSNWSEETVANLKAVNASNTEWSDIEKSEGTAPTDISKENCFWQVVASGAEGITLSANGVNIKETEGLIFTNTSARSLAIAVNYQTVDESKSFGPYHGASYLWLGSKNQNYIVIPNVKSGSEIKIGLESHKTTDARGVELYAGRGNSGTKLLAPDGSTVSAPTTYQEQVWALPNDLTDTPNADGSYDVTIRNTNGCHLYYIEVVSKKDTVVLSTTDTTAVELDKVYVLDVKSSNHIVTYTATVDGYLSLTADQTISTSNVKLNGIGLTATAAAKPTTTPPTPEIIGSYSKDANGNLTNIPMAAGDVFCVRIKTTKTPPVNVSFAFTEGANPLTLTASSPSEGAEWSGAEKYKPYSSASGAAYYYFSALINPETVSASVKVGEKVYENVEVKIDSYTAFMYVSGLADTLKAAAAEGLIGAGDQFTVTLSGLQDKTFSNVTLEDQTFTYTMGNTSCTGITPAASTSLTLDKIQEAIFHFDGKVNIDNAKFYLLNLVDGSKVELAATVDGVDLVIPVASVVEGIMPRLFDIVAEGVTDAKGNALTYSSNAADAEEGVLKIHYGMNLTPFAPVAVPAQNDTVFSLKTFTLTYPVDVIYNASVATSEEVKLTSNYGETLVSAATLAVSETDPKVVTITLAEEIKTPGEYALEVPAKLLWANEPGYNPEDLSTKGSAKYGYYQSSIYWKYYITPFEPKTSSPAAGATVNLLDKITLGFSEEVDVNDEFSVVAIVSAEMGVAPDTIAVGEIAYDYNDYTKVIITLDKAIDSLGNYRLLIPAGAVFAVADETRVTSELSYDFTVDPDYWDPEWVVEVGANCTEEAPCQLIAGRKYNFTEMYSYATFTATENGRVYLTAAEDSDLGDMWMCDADWVRTGVLNSAEDGGLWFGVVAGETYYITNYGFGSRIVQVTFDGSQSPFEPIAYIGANPADGGIWSKSVKGQYSYTKGAVEFVFTHDIDLDAAQIFVVLPSKDNKEIDVTDLAYPETGSAYNVSGRFAAFDMREAMEEVKTQNGLKSGDKVQIVLKNVQDANFADNKLEGEFKLELTLAATVCTSVYPNCEYGGVDAIPSVIEFQFDGNVTCTDGKGWIIDVQSGEKQEFAIENFACDSRENWDGSLIYMASVALPEATIELTSRKFDIQLEGLVDDEGNAVSYGSEAGKFVINYYFRDDCLNFVTADPADETEVTSFATTKLTYAEEVHLNPSEDIERPYFYANDDIVYGTMAIDPNDPKSVIITWEKEITKPGRYGITIEKGSIYDSKFDATKEDYGVADGASYNPYYDITYYIPADVSATTVLAVTPEPTVGWMATPLSQLPEEVVIEFEGTVKEVVSAYSEVGSVWSDGAAIPEGTTALQSRIEDNKVILTIPAEHISTVTMGQYTITVNALGEDGKPIGYAFDNFGEYDAYAECISFSYSVEKTLELISAVPADGATVKQLDKVVLTFSENIFETDNISSAIRLWDEMWDKSVEPTVTFEGNVATLTFDPAVTEAGYYDLVIYQGFFATEEYIGNSELYFGLTVDPNYVDEPVVEDLAIVSATPENGATVSNLTTVELKLNKKVGYLYKSMLIPADGGDDAASASLTQSETDPTSYTLDFTFEGLFADGAALRKGVTYTMTLEAYASEEAWQRDGAHETVTLTYVGDAEAFQYSDVTFEGITPAEDFVITDKSQNKFTVKFSGAVEMVDDYTFINLGQGATEKFASIEANADKTEYTLTIAESLLATLRNEVYIVFAANDLNGKRVQGNNGEEEFSCFAYSFKTVIGVPDLTVTPDAAVEQASLSVFSIKCAEGLAPSWMANITLTDANGNAFALNDPEAVVAEGASEWDTPTEWTVALQEELTAVGTYTLTIPAGCFNLGSTQGQVMGNKETVVVFNITAEAQGIKAVTADTEVKVYNVAGVAVAQGKAAEILKNLTKGIYIVNGKKYVVK